MRDSLKRLQLDYIDVLQCEWRGVLARGLGGCLLRTGHRLTPGAPFEEMVRGIIPECETPLMGSMIDACLARTRPARSRALHRHELLLGLPMYVIMLLHYSLFRLTLT